MGYSVLEDACAALARCGAPPGRMQPDGGGAQPLVLVDYAHTPDALSKALHAAREHCTGRLWCVFGCGGERDEGKRFQMGQVAAQLADALIVTDDNPRREDPQRIVAAIMQGIMAAGAAGARVWITIGLAAISSALRQARAGDVVLDRWQRSRRLSARRRRAPRVQRRGRRAQHIGRAGRHVIRTLQQFAAAGHGRLIGEDRDFNEVAIDSRKLAAGDLFAALRGEHTDGHEFVEAAAAAGAAGAIVQRKLKLPLPQIVVSNVEMALAEAARAARAQFRGPMIGVAGSNGKTTVKEMLSAILSRLGPCLSTRGNLNNHLGVPMTLLRLDDTHRSAVIEMGANRRGDVEQLVQIARPGIGLITNAGAEHLEGFGSLEGAARAEGEMVAGLSSSGTAVINADDAYASLWRASTSAQVLGFGLRQEADFRARDVRSRSAPRACHPLSTVQSAGRGGYLAGGRGPPQRAQRTGRRDGRQQRRRVAAGYRRRPGHRARREGASAVQTHARRRMADRRFLQCQSQFGARRIGGVERAAGPALAGAGRHGGTGRFCERQSSRSG
jgi:murE/murF fusion protein